MAPPTVRAVGCAMPCLYGRAALPRCMAVPAHRRMQRRLQSRTCCTAEETKKTEAAGKVVLALTLPVLLSSRLCASSEA